MFKLLRENLIYLDANEKKIKIRFNFFLNYRKFEFVFLSILIFPAAPKKIEMIFIDFNRCKLPIRLTIKF